MACRVMDQLMAERGGGNERSNDGNRLAVIMCYGDCGLQHGLGEEAEEPILFALRRRKQQENKASSGECDGEDS